MADEVVIERLRLKIPNAHIFKLPPKPSAGGWRGGDWKDKIWQGSLKVVERNDNTAVLLVDAQEENNIFAVCPINHQLDERANNGGNGVDRCIDSSRYFVLRIQNAQGRHMFIGLAFNERNDAFDFNTALEDSRREKVAEKKAAAAPSLGNSRVNSVDYKMKEGEKIKVSIGIGRSSGGGDGGAAAKRRLEKARSSNTGSGGFLKPSSKDTPSRLA
ncbi:adaptin ear-binding coat-associated protein [Skeletonema marinoi]|uniref:Adaptin ear-binding coat-associated protein n=1 Tax=Skeletonema marinoi TaxID=267567 RepID=A0AAD8XS78_9STRA|nr:adaptin ear-binding coat-associated protein [Skeletonema marinoi]